MSRRLLLALFIAGVVAANVVDAAGDRRPQMRIGGWGRVVDPDGDCSVSIEGARVTIRVPETSHEFAAELDRWNAPRIVRTVRQDFVAQVKVCGDFEPPPGGGTTKGRKAYHGGGLLLAADEQNHLSIHRAAFRDGDRVQNYLNFELRRDGKVVTDRYQMSVPNDADGYVRLERHGKRFIGMFSPDGVNWESYEPIETDFPSEARIGVVVVNSTKQPFTCGFEAFELFRVSATNKASAAESDVATATGVLRPPLTRAIRRERKAMIDGGGGGRITRRL